MKKDNKNKATEKKDKSPKVKGKGERVSKRAQYKAVATDTPLILKDADYNNNITGLYTDEVLPKLEKYCSQGLNNKEIAQALMIGEKTFYDWRGRYPQFRLALAKYRGVADIFVENALYANCVGFEYTEEMAVAGVGRVKVKKFQTGDTKAQIFYLKNRMPERYKDKIETVINLPQDISQIAFAIKRREE